MRIKTPRRRAGPRLLALVVATLLATIPLAKASEKPRAIVLTDISNEPDDEESMVRFLVYSNELDVEGLIATTSTHLRDRTREDLIRRQVEAYGQVRGNLARHAPGFPEKDELLAVTHTGQPDTVTADDGHTYTSDMATIWRWREHFQHDFAARMDWCVAPKRDEANHNPVAIVNGDATKHILEIEAKPGETVTLSAEGSSDPDGDSVSTSWFVYPEAGSHGGDVSLSGTIGATTRMVAPSVEKPETVHVILQVEDQGDPHLFAYRRVIVTVTP